VHAIGDTADRILDVAERLVQVRGFNAFSYADVAHELGVRKASLHYHYPTKAALGVALVDRYRRTFLAALDVIESETSDAFARLERYVELFRAVLLRGQMCMCGMLASDVETLPDGMRASIGAFFADNEAWLTRVLEHGRERHEVRFHGHAAETAMFFVSTLEGAMLVARANGRTAQFDAVAAQLLERVRVAQETPR